MSRSHLRDEGFTLIELVAAMAVFALAAGAVLSVLLSGIRTAGLARDRTLAKDVARQQLEEMRRLPYYRDYATFPRKVDVLDFYFPDDTAPAYSSATKSYTTTTTGSVGRFDYRMEVVTAFVEPLERETVPVEAGYQWNSATDDKPAADMLDVRVRVSWPPPNYQRAFTLQTYLGEGRLSAVVLQGSTEATVVEIETGFSDGSILLGRTGVSSSSVFVGEGSTSRNDTLGATARVTLPDTTVTSISGASAAAVAPPDTGPLSDDDPTGADLSHPNAALAATLPLTCRGGTVPRCVASIGHNRVEGVFAAVTSAAPNAGGNMNLSNTAGTLGISVTNEVNGADLIRKLDATRPFVTLTKGAAGANSTRVETTCSDTGATVDCQARPPSSAEIMGDLQMIPVTLGGSSRYLVTVRFTNLAVQATTNRAAPASAVASCTATGEVRYWRFDALTGWTEEPVPITSCTGAALPDPTLVPLAEGRTLADYIVSWSAVPAVVTTTSADGREATAELRGAFRMVTRPTNSNLGFESSGFIVSVGRMRAQAFDAR